MTLTLSLHDALPISINSFAPSGDFAATSTGASACPTSPATLAAGANCTINVTFTPTASGARTGTLSLTDNAGGSPQVRKLTRLNSSPVGSSDATCLVFDNQLLE